MDLGIVSRVVFHLWPLTWTFRVVFHLCPLTWTYKEEQLVFCQQHRVLAEMVVDSRWLPSLTWSVVLLSSAPPPPCQFIAESELSNTILYYYSISNSMGNSAIRDHNSTLKAIETALAEYYFNCLTSAVDAVDPKSTGYPCYHSLIVGHLFFLIICTCSYTVSVTHYTVKNEVLHYTFWCSKLHCTTPHGVY